MLDSLFSCFVSVVNSTTSTENMWSKISEPFTGDIV